MGNVAPATSSPTPENGGQNSQKLRVAIVSPDHWYRVMGGAEYQAMLLADRLHEKHEVDIHYFVARAGERTEFQSHRVIPVGREGFLSRYGSFWDVFRLYRALTEFSPDVIYQRVGCAYTGVVARYAMQNRISCIWHVANEADTDRMPPVYRVFSKPHFFLERYLLNFGRRRVDKIVVQSERQAKLLRRNLGLEAYRVIRNFHPVPQENVEKDENFIVCWIANLKLLKKPERFLEIAGHLEDLGHVRFVIVGRPYPESHLQQTFEHRLSAHDNVDYIEGLPQEDINKLLLRSRILVNTSPREGFSNVFIQAWMREVPVLTLGVNPDGLLDDGYLGGAFESTGALADSLRDLAQAPNRLSVMGKRCREVALAKFSMCNADELADLIVKSAEHSQMYREQGTVA